MKIKTPAQALEALRRADAAKLYESLEPWQQRELLCIVRRLVNDLKVITEKLPNSTDSSSPGQAYGAIRA